MGQVRNLARPGCDGILKICANLFLFSSLAFAQVFAAAAEMSAPERLARDYLAAYSAVDTAAMERFLASGAVFADQTARPADGGPIVLSGRDTFLKQFKTYGLTRLAYELASVFESNGRVVFIGRVNAFYPQTGGELQFSSRIVTVITVENGKVARHEDFADYANAKKFVQKRGGAQ